MTGTYRHVLTSRLPVVVRKEFLGCSEDVLGQVFAVEFYPQSVPTFTFLARSGHVYAYLPPHAFSFAAPRDLAELVDVECPASPPSVYTFDISGGGFGRVGETVVCWQRYLCSIDWAKENILIHCVLLFDGSFAFLRNSRFQIGGESWNPPDWRKLRHDWRLSNRDVCLVVRRGDLFLGVSRKNDFNSFGLPAGKCEESELPIDAARRELKEETGLTLDSATLLDEGQWGDRYIYCFLAEVSGELLDENSLIQRGEGVARWVDPEVLLKGEFGAYNGYIFSSYNLYGRGL